MLTVMRSPAATLKQEREMNANPPGKSEVNRATQFGYAPGSTFKIVTATAAIDTGAYTPESTVSGPNGLLVSGHEQTGFAASFALAIIMIPTAPPK